MKARSLIERVCIVGLSVALTLVLVLVTSSLAQPVQAVSNGIVISQVYGGGGNSGATLTNDFVELFNRGTTAVNVTNWSVQYASSAGSSWSKTTLSGTIQPGQYYLVQEAQGSGGTTALPTPDATGSIAMSATNGKVALVNSTTTLTGSCPSGSPVVDFVGFGSANCSETSPAPVLSNTTADFRANDGCTDTDDNSADFATGAPNPRNTASPTHSCTGPTNPSGVGAADPSNVARGGTTLLTVTVTPGTNPTSTGLTVVGNLTSIGGSAAQPFYDDGTHGDVTAGDNVFSFQATVANTTATCGQTIPITIADAQSRTGTTSISLNVFASPVAIHTIQGASHISPYNNQCVGGTAGIVTALRSNGFYMQDPHPDGNPSTSEGIFVYTGSQPTVSVGDAVVVVGQVSEYRPGGASTGNLTTTEMGSVTVQIVSHGNALPAPTIIGNGGRLPPSTVIEDDATGSVENSGVFDPATDGIDFYESLEGMRVQLNDALVVGPTHDFGSNREVYVVADSGAHASLRTSRGGLVIRPGDFNPERIVLNDLIVGGPTLPPVNVRDQFPGATLGVIDYNYGNFDFEVTQLPTPLSGDLTQEKVGAAGAKQLAVATFNVENLAPTDPPSKFSTLANLIVQNLRSPDLIAVEEVQDNNGTTDNGTVDSSTTWNMLISAIQNAGGPTYQFRQIDPVNDADGGAPGGNIRQGFLFRVDRGLAFIDRPGGGSTTATSVVAGSDGPQLSSSPGRIDPNNPAFNDSRKPLAGEFTFNGHHLFVIANHFNSKGGDDPLFGRYQPPVFGSATQRTQQATVVHNFVASILSIDSKAEVVVLGDLNDFQFSGPMQTLKGNILKDLIETLPEKERYTYDYQGNSETLDHILLSNQLFNQPYVYKVVHVNSEFAVQASDHDPQVVDLNLAKPTK
jgi:predicted extracellular nuclease